MGQNNQPRFQDLRVKDRDIIVEGLRHGVSRRDILKWLGAAGITAAAGAGILADAGVALAQTPKRGGKMRVAGHSTSANDTLDPAKQTLSTDYIRGYIYFNGLTRLDGNIAAQPELAESLEPNATATEWVFRLRQGVEFHDGKSLTPQDVVYSLMRHKDPAVGSAAKALSDQIDTVTADGPDLVRVKLKEAYADLPIMLGTSHFMILQDGTTDFSTAIGTGPFRMQEFSPGVRSIGTRFDNYFKEGQPYLDEIEFIGIQDNVARVNALLSGDVQAITNLPPSAIEEVKSRPELALLTTPSATFSEVIMMCDRQPTDNLDLRLAIKYLLDRERYVTSVLKGYGQLGNDHVVPPNDPLYNKDLPQRTVDLDKAKFHLGKSGFGNGRLELHVSDAAVGTVPMGQILQQTAAQAGLAIDLKREPADGYWSNIWIKRPFHGGQWNARPTIDIQLSLGWLSDSSWNAAQFKDATLDQLIVQGRSELDVAKRKQIYGDIQKILYDRGGNGAFGFQDFLDGLSAKVKGITPVPIGNLGGFAFPDTAWLES
ncbi:MAG: ABC transporter substrate-binding protein [Rhodobacteraceae bacterium]|nr:ABC transporter substrate-binding protein [Paracoccaceae bacterium]